MRDLLLSMIRRRARMAQESRPRPDDGYERVVLDSNQDIIIDGVSISAANGDVDRGAGNPLKFVLWIVAILVLATAASGYWNTLPDRIRDYIDDLRQPGTSMPRLPDTGAIDPSVRDAAPTDSAPIGSDQPDPETIDPRSKKNTY